MTDPCCVVVADSARARLFLADTAGGGKRRLTEQADLTNADYRARGTEAPQMKTERNTNREAGPMHPQFEKRAQHRLELEHRFAREIAHRAVALVQGWRSGTVMLVAPPHMLGQLREVMRNALPRQLTLKELACEYMGLTADELANQLELQAGGPGRGT